MNITCAKCFLEFQQDQQLDSKSRDTLVLELIRTAGLDYYDHWDKLYLEEGHQVLVLNGDEKYALAKISLNDLSSFSTRCGKIPNKPFDPKVISHLQDSGADYVLAIIDQDEETVVSLAAPLNERLGNKFERMISKNGGSLRWDPSEVEGWSVFESE